MATIEPEVLKSTSKQPTYKYLSSADADEFILDADEFNEVGIQIDTVTADSWILYASLDTDKNTATWDQIWEYDPVGQVYFNPFNPAEIPAHVKTGINKIDSALFNLMKMVRSGDSDGAQTIFVTKTNLS